jgi:hypothetical protein
VSSGRQREDVSSELRLSFLVEKSVAEIDLLHGNAVRDALDFYLSESVVTCAKPRR